MGLETISAFVLCFSSFLFISLRYSSLRPPNPRSSRRWNFKISATRHGVINWEEFWEKICGSFCTVNEARKCAENFAQFFAQTSARVIKICRRNFALGKVRRNSSFFFACLCFILPGQGQTTAIYWNNGEFHCDPLLHRPCSKLPEDCL